MLSLARSSRYLKKCLFDAGGGRNYTTSVYDESSRMKKPFMSSISLSVDDDKYIKFNFPGLGLAQTESDESLTVLVDMPGVKKEHVEACLETGPLLCIQGKKYEQSYHRGKISKEICHSFMDLPNNINIAESCMIKTEMQDDGMFKVTLPKLKDKDKDKARELKNNIFNDIIFNLKFKFSLRLFAIIPSLIMTFARPFVIDRLCPHSYTSFTMYKKETSKGLHISVKPGLHKLDYVKGGAAACVSLNMPGLRMQDVKSFFKHDTLFIQGKTKTKTNKVHYITGIRLPEYYSRKHSMIKEEMQDGMYKATIPIVTLSY